MFRVSSTKDTPKIPDAIMQRKNSLTSVGSSAYGSKLGSSDSLTATPKSASSTIESPTIFNNNNNKIGISSSNPPPPTTPKEKPMVTSTNYVYPSTKNKQLLPPSRRDYGTQELLIKQHRQREYDAQVKKWKSEYGSPSKNLPPPTSGLVAVVSSSNNSNKNNSSNNNKSANTNSNFIISPSTSPSTSSKGSPLFPADPAAVVVGGPSSSLSNSKHNISFHGSLTHDVSALFSNHYANNPEEEQRASMRRKQLREEKRRYRINTAICSLKALLREAMRFDMYVQCRDENIRDSKLKSNWETLIGCLDSALDGDDEDEDENENQQEEEQVLEDEGDEVKFEDPAAASTANDDNNNNSSSEEYLPEFEVIRSVIQQLGIWFSDVPSPAHGRRPDALDEVYRKIRRQNFDEAKKFLEAFDRLHVKETGRFLPLVVDELDADGSGSNNRIMVKNKNGRNGNDDDDDDGDEENHQQQEAEQLISKNEQQQQSSSPSSGKLSSSSFGPHSFDIHRDDLSPPPPQVESMMKYCEKYFPMADPTDPGTSFVRQSRDVRQMLTLQRLKREKKKFLDDYAKHHHQQQQSKQEGEESATNK